MGKKNFISTPHDDFFKESMSNLRVAKDFFRHHLPQLVLEKVDLDTLQIQPGSFIDEERKHSSCDILYQVQCGDHPIYLYVLTEHQSPPDRLLSFYVWKYVFRIMDKHLENPSKLSGPDQPLLPLVVPIVFNTGLYPASDDISEPNNESSGV